jgi:K+-transporting ATPase KdpF subunit
MIIDYVLASLICMGLLGYLLYVLLNPESF